jgi:molybdopterin-guanine dinucleotide biosynthesis protein A
MTLVIQAGGSSTRMGSDKALAPFLGKTLIERVLERTASIASEVLITTNSPENYAFLGISQVPDLLPGQGALSGLFTALNAASHVLVAVVACDMPFANAALLAAQRDWLVQSDAAAVIPRTERGLEPFHAVYHAERCIPAVQAALQAGKRRVDSWLPDVKIRYLTLAEIMYFDPQDLAFRNVNTPEELEQAQIIALDLEKASPEQ